MSYSMLTGRAKVDTKNTGALDEGKLRWLAEKLSLLAEYGGDLKDGHFWYEREEAEIVHSEHEDRDTRDDAGQTALKSLEYMKTMRTMLNQLAQSIDEARPGLLRVIDEHDVFGTRVADLPVEILMNICETVCCDEHEGIDLYYLAQFQLVCRQFREVALNTPHIWSDVTTMMSVDRIQLCLLHSAGMSMRLFVGSLVSISNHCICNQLDIIKSHGDRWSSVLMDFGELRFPPDHEFIGSIVDVFLPNLRKLAVENISAEYAHSLSWIMPNVSHLTCDTETGLLLPVTESIRRLEFDPVYTSINFEMALEHLVPPLTANLTELSLDASWMDPIDPDVSSINSHAVLKQLRSLKVMGLDNPPRAAAMYRFLTHIEMPRLVNCIVVIYHGAAEGEGIYSWLSTLGMQTLRLVYVTFVNTALDDTAAKAIRERLLNCVRVRTENGVIRRDGKATVRLRFCGGETYRKLVEEGEYNVDGVHSNEDTELDHDEGDTVLG